MITTKPKKDIIAIVGTTGVGKSKFSIELAKAINGEIINADSMQVYKGLDIITNKHPIDEREGITHHVMNHVNWSEEYFIHRFSQEANEAINNIYDRGKIPIIIGGTHYYLQKLLFKNKTIQDETKQDLTSDQLHILDGPVEGIYEELQKYDPVIAQKFHPQDKRKLRRALEIWYSLNQKPSELYKEQKLDELEDSSLIYNTIFFWLYSDTDVLQSRLNSRVDTMIDTGAIDEINQLYDFYKHQTPTPSLTNGIWQVIGFKEFIPWLELNPDHDSQKYITKSYNEAIERMKIRTRQYAKYQIKWIKKILLIELQKEVRFNYKYGGKLYLLNASDLSKWDTEVKCRGVEIGKEFINNGPNSVKQSQKPDSIKEGIFPGESDLTEFNSNKRLDSVRNWRHFKCEYCFDKQGNPLVSVGEDQWQVHVNSRRHKKNEKHGNKRQKIEGEQGGEQGDENPK